MPYVFPVVESLLLPPGLFVLLLVAAFLLFRFDRRKSGVVVGSLSVLLLYLFSIRPIADLLITPLENHYPAYRSGGDGEAEFVVVLGGGVIPVSPAEGGRASLAPEALKRLVYGIRIARESGLPLVVSGGIVPSNPAKEAEAEVARRAVEQLSGPSPKVLTEALSRTTWGNAVDVEAKFHPSEIILVTSAYHMPRSVLAFNRNHIRVVPAPTDYLSYRGGYTFYSFLPGAGPLKESAIAIKEYLGYLYYRSLLFTTRRSS